MDASPDAIKQAIRQAYSAVSDGHDGFHPRSSQRRMIAEIAKTLLGEYESRLLAVEGPTGTGKSLAYLLGALPVALAQDKTLIISTSTVALQDQLCHKDIPFVANVTGIPFTYELIKGRGRYLCERDLMNLVDGTGSVDSVEAEGEGDDDAPQQGSFSGLWTVKPLDGEPQMLERMAAAWSEGAWDGDFDEWKGPALRNEVQAMIASTRLSCSKSRCEFYDSCAFFKARARAREANVLVANHSLVVSDLLMGGGIVLPAPEDCIYVFDEGHDLHTRALAQSAAATTLRGPQQWLKHLPTTARQVANVLPRSAQKRVDRVVRDLVKDHERTVNALRALHRVVDQSYPNVDEQASEGKRKNKPVAAEPWRFALGRVEDEALLEGAEQAGASASLLSKHAAALVEMMDKAVKDEEVDARTAAGVMPSLVWTQQRIDAMCEALKGFATVDDADPRKPPHARWIERAGKDANDYLVAISSTSVAGFLEQSLWTRCHGAIITSATLTSLGNFQRLREQLGLVTLPAQTCRLPSPFDYPRLARLFVPRMRALPSDKRAHTAEIIDRLGTDLIVGDAGTLVLFSSYWQMREVREGLPSALRERVLMQGEAPRQTLIDNHRERVESGVGSVLFGVASFAEGLDLPGALCEHVIIAKLPFSVPTSPVDATYAEWLESVGRNPFMEMSVPDASLRLIQASGRLIRSEQDHGQVTVLDRRLVTKRYGKAMIDALPPFTRVIEPDADAA